MYVEQIIYCRIDMYVEGTTDLMGMIMYLPFQPADTKEKNLALIIERATTRYFPVYEKVSDESPVVHKDNEFQAPPPTPLPCPHKCIFQKASESVTLSWSLYPIMGKEGHKIIFGWFQYWVSLLSSFSNLA